MFSINAVTRFGKGSMLNRAPFSHREGGHLKKDLIE
jgi:hypothetical protein